MRRGLVLPDVAGVWTLEEDRILRRGEVNELKKLDKKHGYGATFERQQFLDTWRALSTQKRRMGQGFDDDED